MFNLTVDLMAYGAFHG